MKSKYIYLKDNYKIEKYNILIDEKKLISIIKKLDNYYNNKGNLQKSYGHLPYSSMSSNSVIEIKSVTGSEELKSKTASLINSPFVTYNYYIFNPVRLSLILRKIIDTNNSIKLSYAINELYNFEPTEKEEELYIEALKNICIKNHNAKLDFTGIILNKMYKIDNNDVEFNYIDDNLHKCINKLPYKK